MDELQLRKIEHIRNALNDLHSKLDIDLYEKVSAAKVSYKKKKTKFFDRRKLGIHN